MLTLTKMKRAYIIDHIMPSDLDKKNIKHGLKLKEEMIDSITDDYIKTIIPDWRQIERDYRKRGVSQYMEKVNCGELTLDDILKPNPIQYDVWIRWKDFNVTEYNNNPMYGLKDYDYVWNPFNVLVCHITDLKNDGADNVLMTWDTDKYIATFNNVNYTFSKLEHNYQLKINDSEFTVSSIDNNVLYFNKDTVKIECSNVYRDGYSEWIKSDDKRQFEFKNKKDTVFQMKIVMYGDNHNRYFPFQSYDITNGWQYISDDVELYDFETGMNEQFYRLFFRNRPGYGDIMYKGWKYENIDWFRINYPSLVDGNKVNASTILCDPFRVKYNEPPPNPQDVNRNMSGSMVVMLGRQWVKSKYLCDMYLLCNFSIHIDNIVLNNV